jgi:dTDP-4-amino-4,6-dideoxygalactose transaminase
MPKAAVKSTPVPTQERMLLVSEPTLGRDERDALCEVIDSRWITMGQRVLEFEKAFAELHGQPDAVAVNSCTAGLHLILAALGIGPGDEVLVPSMTFVATANSVLYTGAMPVFVDIDALDRPLMSIDHADAKCTPRTKAVVLVHFAGYVVEREAWRDFAAQRGLLLVEDAAHVVAIDEVGTYGDGAAFSFYGNKNMTTAEGGMVLARDPDVLERARRMRGHGMTSGTFQRLTARTAHYDVTMLGFNYRLDEMRAAIGLAQLAKVPAWNRKRKLLAGLYRTELARHCPGVIVPFRAGETSAHHIMPVVLPDGVDRDAVAVRLREARIQTTVHYPPIHGTSFYAERYPSVRLPKTEAFARRELTIPLHPAMEPSDVERVVRAIGQILNS